MCLDLELAQLAHNGRAQRGAVDDAPRRDGPRTAPHGGAYVISARCKAGLRLWSLTIGSLEAVFELIRV